MSEENNPELQALEDRRKLKERPSRARYQAARAALDKKWRRRELRADRMMREVVDELWDQFGQSPYSWIGFYLLSPDGSQLVLGPHRDKPACSPIPLRGVCGKVLQTKTSMNVPDVKALGDAHVECDPRNLSEICVPVFDKNGKVFAVLDVDSAQKAAFDEMDQRWLEQLIKPFQEINRDF